MRVAEYQPSWLDGLCFSGEVAWGRLSLRSASSDGRGVLPSRATPITLAMRPDLPWLIEGVRRDQRPEEPRSGASSEVLALLREKGALFFGDLISGTGRLPAEVEEALWDLVSRGLVTGDGFHALRTLLIARGRGSRWRGGGFSSRNRIRLRRIGEGRWTVLPVGADLKPTPTDDLAEAVAEQLLKRYGIVFRDLITRESLSIPWRDILRVLRRDEARGTVRGGRFVAGFNGEQYALPEAVDGLRRTRRKEKSGEVIRISAADPLNLVGILTPGSRVPAIHKNCVIYRDGIPVASEEGGQRVIRAPEGEEAAREVRMRARLIRR